MAKIILLIAFSTYVFLGVECTLSPVLQALLTQLAGTSQKNFQNTDLDNNNNLVEEELMALFKGVAGKIYKQDHLTYAQYSKHFAPDEDMETSAVSQYFFDMLDSNTNLVIDSCDMKAFFKNMDTDSSNNVTSKEYTDYHQGLAMGLIQKGQQNAIHMATC